MHSLLKLEFLNAEFSALTLTSGLATRNANWPIYATNISEECRNNFKEWVRQELAQISKKYENQSIAEETHIKNIEGFIKSAGCKHGSALHNGKLRFGVAQKLLNLYLKYKWASGQITEPPHCPIDGLIAAEGNFPYSWTTSDCPEEYRSAIKSIRSRCAELSIAQCELQMFNNVRNRNLRPT